MELSILQDFINKHSRFTDSTIEELVIKNIDNKYDNVEFIINSKFENYRIKVKCNEVVEARFNGIYNYSIWELELEKDGEFYIFNPSAVSAEMGDFYLKAKKIEFIEL